MLLPECTILLMYQAEELGTRIKNKAMDMGGRTITTVAQSSMATKTTIRNRVMGKRAQRERLS